MVKPIVFFGVGKIAEVISYYASEECGISIAAYTVDEKFKDKDVFLGKPVVPFESIEQNYPPEKYDMFIGIGYHQLNQLRTSKFNESQLKGYNLISIVSESCNLPKNVTYGKNCFIMPPSMIHPCVRLADNVFVFNGALVGHHSFIGNNCWITSNASIGGNASIGENSFLAMDVIIGNSISIGKNCFVGSNCQVIKDMLDEQVVISEGSKPIKLNSQQFFKFSNFKSL